MKYSVFANCPRNGKHECNIVSQLWRPTGIGHFTLIRSISTGYDSNQIINHQPEILSFSLDMEFTGDLVGLNLDQIL